jgi:hypothetical protein
MRAEASIKLHYHFMLAPARIFGYLLPGIASASEPLALQIQGLS